MTSPIGSRFPPLGQEVLSTPVVTINKGKLVANIEKMATDCREKGIRIRPHFKAHKLIPIARLQKLHGAAGFTVAKLSEAKKLVDAGFDDVLVAYPLWGEDKWERYFSLAHRSRLKTIIDSFEAYEAWERQAGRRKRKVDVYIKVDSGLHRAGYPPGDRLIELTIKVANSPRFNLRGLLTHAGHVYSTNSTERRRAIGLDEGQTLLRVAQTLKSRGISVAEISVGATPTVEFNLETPGVTEVRPGNYVFYDATQIRLGVVSPERCALSVLTTVVSKPAPDRRIIDAGAKVLALDQGAHGQSVGDGFGMLSVPGWKLTRLSEEHGILERIIEDAPDISPGYRLQIIPNHACPVINLADKVVVVDEEGKPLDVWTVDARGCSR